MQQVYGNLTQSKWDKIEKEFLFEVNSYFNEINDSIQILRKNKENPLIKSQLCLALVAADSFARFYCIFQDKLENLNGNNEKRFKQWLNAFVFNNENEIYREHKNKINCDAGIAWKLRNSFLHFYSLPETENGRKIGFLFNTSEEFHKKIQAALRKEGQNMVFIDAYYFIDAILYGFPAQEKYFSDMIKNSPDKYIKAVCFSHEIVMRQNTRTIMLDN